MKPNNNFGCLVLALTVCFASGCLIAKKDGSKAGATPPGKTNSLPAAVDNAGTNATLALVALDKKFASLQAEHDALKLSSAKAAAQVGSANIANTNQPPSPATQVVDRETRLAMTNLPPQDVPEALASTLRRTALLEGRVVEAEAGYKRASSESDQMKAEQVRLKSETDKARAEAEAQRLKATEAQAALVEAEKRQAAELEKNRAENQSKLDAANKKADEAVQKAYEERQNLLVRILMGIGAASILAGIGLAIATSGASIWRSGIAVFCGFLCFGLSKVLSHPYFNTIFSLSCLVVLAGAGVYLWREHKHVLEFRDTAAAKVETETRLLLVDKTLKHVVKAVEAVRGSSPEMNKVLEEHLDAHTDPDSTRQEYIMQKAEHTT